MKKLRKIKLINSANSYYEIKLFMVSRISSLIYMVAGLKFMYCNLGNMIQHKTKLCLQKLMLVEFPATYPKFSFLVN